MKKIKETIINKFKNLGRIKLKSFFLCEVEKNI